MSKNKTATPYRDLLPPLSTTEFEALKADIKANGVHTPVVVDEDGNVLDGHHRLKCDKDAPRRVVKGLSPAAKQAFVFRANFTRRNLSHDQKKAASKAMKVVAVALREEDPKCWTQAKIAVELGVSQPAVSMWLDVHNISTYKAHAPDARVKIPATEKPVILDRIEAGETQEQVAADYGINRSQISRVVTVEKKAKAEKKKQAAAAKKVKGDCGVLHGDFRVIGDKVADDSVQLVFTDPPYDDVGCYGDLARFASRVLCPGGWLIAYAGKSHLAAVMAEMDASDLTYGWTFCIRHTGGDARFRKFKLQTGWKPAIGFYKPKLSVTWDWFPDVVSGGKEKDLHPWQQAESEALHFIERMSSKKGFVCDPFAGSGTTLAAAKSCGRRWIGFEIAENHVEAARARLAE